MAKLVQLKIAVILHLLITWSAIAHAADASTFVSGIEAIPLEAFGYVAGIAFASGSAATLIKVARPDVVVRSLALEVTKDLVSSVVAGMLMFFVTSWREVPLWPQLGLILVAGYGGTKVLDLALADGLFPWLGKALGRLPDAAPPVRTPRSEEPTP